MQRRKHRHLHRALAPARLDRQCPRDRRVVLSGLRRTVFRGVVHPHRNVPRAVHAHRERQHRALALHPGIGHREPGVPLRHRNDQCRRDGLIGPRHAVHPRCRGIERHGQRPVLPAFAVEGDRDRDCRLGLARRELQPVAAEPVAAPFFRRGHTRERVVRHADGGVGLKREPSAPAHPDHERLAFRRRRAKQLRP